MKIESLKDEVKEILQSIELTEENREFWKGHVKVILGEKYNTRTQNDELLFEEAINEVMGEILSKAEEKGTIQMQSAVEGALKDGVTESEISGVERDKLEKEDEKEI